MPEPLDYELKVGRAHKHLKDLGAGVTEWVNGKHHSVRNERHPDGRLAFFATAEQPPKDPFSILIGDTLHALRSGLDLLAYSLALAHTKPLPDDLAETSEFPIFGDEDRKGRARMGAQMFRDNGRFKVRGVHPDALAEIERLQPYHAGDWRKDPLWRLQVLDNINKHRLLHTAIAHSGGFLLNPSKCYNCQIVPGVIESPGGHITTDTLIARAPIERADPRDPQMHVEIQPALNVTFGQGVPGVEYEAVMPVVVGIFNHVVVDVIPAFAKFL